LEIVEDSALAWTPATWGHPSHHDYSQKVRPAYGDKDENEQPYRHPTLSRQLAAVMISVNGIAHQNAEWPTCSSLVSHVGTARGDQLEIKIVH
jgi:hypothetical protein